MKSFEGVLSAPLEAIQSGIEKHEATYGQPELGERITGVLNYPCVLIYPEPIESAGDSKYTSHINVLFNYGVLANRKDKILDIIKEVEPVIQDIHDALKSQEDVGAFLIDEINPMTNASEEQNNMFMIEVRIKYNKLR